MATRTCAHFRAVLFDFDGTLADSYAAIAASVNHVRASRGLPPLAVEAVKRHVGRGPEHLIAATVPGGDLAVDVGLYRAHHPSVMGQLTELLPGASTLLGRLRQSGRRVGLCSNKPRNFSHALLKQFQVLQHFEVVLGPEDVQRPKPHPEMLLKALDLLGCAPADVLYVGDMVVDIETARQAGVCVWVVPTGSDETETLRRAEPDRLLADLCEMVSELPVS